MSSRGRCLVALLAAAIATTTFGALGNHALAQQAAGCPQVVDLHVDLPYRLHVHARRLDDPHAEASPERLRQGGVRLVVLPLFVPDAWRETPTTVRAQYEATYRSLMGALQSRTGRDVFGAPGEPADGRRVSTMLALEGADGFADDPEALRTWIARGVCLVGLVHARTNALAGSSTEPSARGRKTGLTAAGELLVRTAYRHGALVDLAHASDAAVNDIARIAQEFGAPLVCSHTAMRALKPIERNVSDAQLHAIVRSGGVVGVDLHSGHLGAERGRPAALQDVVRHLEHAKRVAGVGHVGLGSDLEGGIVEPLGGVGAATWPVLARTLSARGWSDREIAAVFGGNARRVLGWAQARGCGRQGREKKQ